MFVGRVIVLARKRSFGHLFTGVSVLLWIHSDGQSWLWCHIRFCDAKKNWPCCFLSRTRTGFVASEEHAALRQLPASDPRRKRQQQQRTLPVLGLWFGTLSERLEPHMLRLFMLLQLVRGICSTSVTDACGGACLCFPSSHTHTPLHYSEQLATVRRAWILPTAVKAVCTHTGAKAGKKKTAESCEKKIPLDLAL